MLLHHWNLFFYLTKRSMFTPTHKIRNPTFSFKVWFHSCVAPFGDFIFHLIGKKPVLVRSSTINQKHAQVLAPFFTNEWIWNRSNVEKLWDEMNEKDREIFDFDMKEFDYPKYLDNYIKGIRKYVFKQDPSSIPRTLRHMKILCCLDLFVKVSSCSLLMLIIFQFFILQA